MRKAKVNRLVPIAVTASLILTGGVTAYAEENVTTDNITEDSSKTTEKNSSQSGDEDPVVEIPDDTLPDDSKKDEEDGVSLLSEDSGDEEEKHSDEEVKEKIEETVGHPSSGEEGSSGSNESGSGKEGSESDGETGSGEKTGEATGNHKTDEENQQAAQDNADAIEDKEDTDGNDITLPDAPTLPEDPEISDDMTPEEKNQELDDYDKAAGEYNDAVDDYKDAVKDAQQKLDEAEAAAKEQEKKDNADKITEDVANTGNDEKQSSNADKIAAINDLLKKAGVKNDDGTDYVVDETRLNTWKEEQSSKLTMPSEEKLASMSVEEQQAAVKAYQEAVEAYNDIINGTDGEAGFNADEMMTAYQKYIDAIDALNKATEQGKTETTTDESTGEQVEVKTPGNEDILTSDLVAQLDSIITEKAKSLDSMSDDEKAAFTAQQSTLNNALNLIEPTKPDDESDENAMAAYKVALAAYEASVPQKPDLSTYKTYAEAKAAVEEYNAKVAIYNDAVAKYNAQLEEYKKLLQTEGTASYKTDLATAKAYNSGSRGDGAFAIVDQNSTIKSALTNVYNLEYGDGKTYTTFIEAAKAKLAELSTNAENLDNDLKKALEAVNNAKAGTEEYTKAVNEYNTLVNNVNNATSATETYGAFKAYNKFVRIFNGGSADDETSGALPSDTEEYIPLTLYTATNETSEKGANGNYIVTAGFFIQNKGTVPIEHKTTKHDNGEYVGFGGNANNNNNVQGSWGDYKAYLNTTYPDEPTKYIIGSNNWKDYYNSDGSYTTVFNKDTNQFQHGSGSNDKDWTGYVRVDAEDLTEGIVIENNRVQRFYLSHLRKADGSTLGDTLEEQLNYYYQNVDKTIARGPEESTVLSALGLNNDDPNLTYKVRWYVVKDSKTGTWGGSVHVDGVVYVLQNGVIYNKAGLMDIQSTYETIDTTVSLDPLSTLSYIGEVKSDGTIDTHMEQLEELTSIDNVADSQVTHTELKTLSKIDTIDYRFSTDDGDNGSGDGEEPGGGDNQPGDEDIDDENGYDDDDDDVIILVPEVTPAVTPVTPAVSPTTPTPTTAAPIAEATQTGTVYGATPGTPAPLDATNTLPGAATPGAGAVLGAHALPQTGAPWLQTVTLAAGGLALSLASLLGKGGKGKHER